MRQPKGAIPWNKGLKVGYSGSRKCEPGCTCNRHVGHAKAGHRCKENCTCGRHQKSAEWRENQRVAHTGRVYLPESIEKMRQAALDRERKPAKVSTCKVCQLDFIGKQPRHIYVYCSSACRKIGYIPWNKGKTGVYSEITLQQIRDKSGHPWSEIDKKAIGERSKILWQDPEYARKVLGSTGACARPNKEEIRLGQLIEPLGFRYIGDGSQKIAGKYPDFIHDVTGSVIELFGEYFHTPDEEQPRIDLFKAAKVKCLVIWAGELKDTSAVLGKVHTFVGRD